ncbi:hypothetical protein COCC4DRAFT_55201 [Bipolaris maydis ATCC 48331]|uniref:Uncharacterized protein n=2 Tax=Cochliobolus heterostrophus TaxID=5016 RepID=M2V7G1_COCH5|nr:uncharacterized protein COCC4DRAFT_55201 [Bipolaris maydis ATCC 48331]EMD95683.1 hypothetical protein COCHEDRAFT_1151786 [Bipolaris maydis C5]ENI10543.1 hypothetical protein COCC4DRAFT_55201 [Bipolaris maydis ATCC 48331]
MATGLRGAIRACVGSSIKSLFSLPWSGLVLLRRSNMVVLAAVPQSYHRAGDAKEKVPRGEKTQRPQYGVLGCPGAVTSTGRPPTTTAHTVLALLGPYQGPVAD